MQITAKGHYCDEKCSFLSSDNTCSLYNAALLKRSGIMQRCYKCLEKLNPYVPSIKWTHIIVHGAYKFLCGEDENGYNIFNIVSKCQPNLLMGFHSEKEIMSQKEIIIWGRDNI